MMKRTFFHTVFLLAAVIVWIDVARATTVSASDDDSLFTSATKVLSLIDEANLVTISTLSNTVLQGETEIRAAAMPQRIMSIASVIAVEGKVSSTRRTENHLANPFEKFIFVAKGVFGNTSNSVYLQGAKSFEISITEDGEVGRIALYKDAHCREALSLLRWRKVEGAATEYLSRWFEGEKVQEELAVFKADGSGEYQLGHDNCPERQKISWNATGDVKASRLAAK
ncbi:MAG: hypothetical protein IAF08_15430 [Rhizobacter sp.]|nr:hypothetical protein [Chlorobiales bacterium]